MRLRGQQLGVPDVITMLPMSCLSNHALTLRSMEILASHLPRQETAFMVAKLNMAATQAHYTDVDQHQRILLRLLSVSHWLDAPDEAAMIRYVGQRREDFGTNPFVGRAGCLEFFRWIATKGNDDDEHGVNNDIPRKRSFARGMLLAFEFWSARTQKRIWQSDSYELINDRQKAFEALRIMREFSIWALPSYFPLWQFGRGRELFQKCYFDKNPQLKVTVETVLRMSLEDYLTCVVALSSLPTHWFDRTGVGLVDNFEFNPSLVCGDAKAMVPIMSEFLKQEAQTIDNLATGFSPTADDPSVLTDLRLMRERPILISRDGLRATILDTCLLADRSSSGLLFKCSQAKGKSALDAFGDAFEEYAARILGRYVDELRARHVTVSAVARPMAAVAGSSKTIEFCDYLISFADCALLIEIKGKWLADKAVGSQTAQEYWDEIADKYVIHRDSRTGKEERAGVSQLVDSIDGWVTGKYELQSGPRVNTVRTIIPILFVHDPHLAALYHPMFLAQEFQQRLIHDTSSIRPEMEYKGHRILNLCLITIDEFEAFEGRDYVHTIAALLEKYSKSVPSRLSSAGGFLARIVQSGSSTLPPIVKSCQDSLNEASLRSFGHPLL